MSAMFYPEFLSDEYARVAVALMQDAVISHRRRCKLCRDKISNRCRTGNSLKSEYLKVLKASGLRSKV